MQSPFPPQCERKFRAERVIASGGFGSVYLATQVELDRPVAVKLLNADVIQDEEQRARFLAEARITASIVHPNVVVVIDSDVEDGIPWIAYEYLPGRSLKDALMAGPLAPAGALEAALQIAAALEAVHAQDILHRDIKPANVIEVEAGRRYKVTDFGIARWSRAGMVRTQAGLVFGTPGYMSPEQIRGEPATPRSDLYALGVTLHELLTGRLPFPDENIRALLDHHLRTPPPLPGALVDGIAPGVDALVLRAMAKDPQERFASAAAFRAAIERCQVGEVSGAADPAARRRPRSSATAVPRTAAESKVEAPSSAGTAARPGRGWWPVGGAVLAVAAIALVAVIRHQPPPPPSREEVVERLIQAASHFDGSRNIDELRGACAAFARVKDGVATDPGITAAQRARLAVALEDLADAEAAARKSGAPAGIAPRDLFWPGAACTETSPLPDGAPVVAVPPDASTTTAPDPTWYVVGPAEPLPLPARARLEALAVFARVDGAAEGARIDVGLGYAGEATPTMAVLRPGPGRPTAWRALDPALVPEGSISVRVNRNRAGPAWLGVAYRLKPARPVTAEEKVALDAVQAGVDRYTTWFVHDFGRREDLRRKLGVTATGVDDLFNWNAAAARRALEPARALAAEEHRTLTEVVDATVARLDALEGPPQSSGERAAVLRAAVAATAFLHWQRVRDFEAGISVVEDGLHTGSLASVHEKYINQVYGDRNGAARLKSFFERLAEALGRTAAAAPETRSAASPVMLRHMRDVAVRAREVKWKNDTLPVADEALLRFMVPAGENPRVEMPLKEIARSIWQVRGPGGRGTGLHEATRAALERLRAMLPASEVEKIAAAIEGDP